MKLVGGDRERADELHAVATARRERSGQLELCRPEDSLFERVERV